MPVNRTFLGAVALVGARRALVNQWLAHPSQPLIGSAVSAGPRLREHRPGGTIPGMPVDLLVVLIIILVLVLMWRGPKTLPKLGEALGRGVRGAREEATKVQGEIQARAAGEPLPPAEVSAPLPIATAPPAVATAPAVPASPAPPPAAPGPDDQRPA